MRAELRDQVRRLLGTWGDVLALVIGMAERRAAASSTSGGGKDTGPTESEKQDVLSATGVVWKACDALLKLCADGVVGLVARKAEQLRAVLLDAIAELKEWGEDVEDSDDDDEDKAGSGDEDDANPFADEDDIFGAENKLGKGDVELKKLLDLSVKKLKMVGLLYQALIKRRLKTYPPVTVSDTPPSSHETPKTETGKDKTAAPPSPLPSQTLDRLMTQLKSIPESVDDLASAFYDLDEQEAREGLEKCCAEAKSAVELVRVGWRGEEDEFSAWLGKWVDALDKAE